MIVELVGGMLIASVWQGSIIAVSLAVVLQLMRRISSATRYTIAVAALAAMLIAPVWTTLHRGSTLAPAGAVVSVAAPNGPQRSADISALAVPARGATTAALERTSRAVASRVEAALPWIVTAWFAGVFLLSLRLVGGAARLRHLVCDGTGVPADRVAAAAQRLALRLGVNRAVRVLASTCVDVPMVVGWVAPVVLIPTSLLTGLAPAQLEMLLAHELAHIRRYDTAINLVQRVIESLLFFHPATWWVSARVREIREDCCDDLVPVRVARRGPHVRCRCHRWNALPPYSTPRARRNVQGRPGSTISRGRHFDRRSVGRRQYDARASGSTKLGDPAPGCG